ncbi:MAG: hypothetical protein M3O86_05110 [Actinomycetota bacterium]|nr:hypothetical protein [Actinomycetota bacterium]
MRRVPLRLLLALALLLSVVPGVSAASAAEEGVHSANLTHIKNIEYAGQHGGVKNYGTDIEFATINGREYALGGTYRNGLQITDITDPENATLVSRWDCAVAQGDVQVFQRDGRTIVAYAADGIARETITTSNCYKEAKALGFAFPTNYGTFFADITDPLNPQTVSFVAVPQGSHNQTVHPSGNFLYVSNSDLITSTAPAIEVFDISDLSKPVTLPELQLPFVPASLGSESHDITFNTAGTRAYSAALSQGVIIDTTEPANPKIIKSFVDPTIQLWHQSDPFTLTAPDGSKRDFLIIEDEYAGAAGGPHCPSGGVHVYEVTGNLERNPVKVGYWNIDDLRPTPKPTGRCTAHVFDIHEDAKIMTMAFYNGGVRVIDLSGLVGYGLGNDTTLVGTPMREIAHYYFPNSDTWAAKTPKIDPVTGDFYLYGSDVARGLDVYKFKGTGVAPGLATAEANRSRGGGRWMSAREAALTLPRANAAATGYKPFCLLQA